MTSLIRVAHQTVMAIHQAETAETTTSFLYFLASLVVLLVVAVLYLNNSIYSSFIIPVSPSEEQRRLIFIIVICLMAGIGFYAAIDHLWHSQTWLHYAIFNLLLALFIFVYQTTKGFSLILSCILMGCLAVDSYWLFHETGDNAIIHVLVGAVQAWAVLWFLYVLGQVMIYDCGLSRKVQNVCFFIAAICVLAFAAFWHMQHHNSLAGMLGFLVAGVLLLILFVRNYQRSVDSLF